MTDEEFEEELLAKLVEEVKEIQRLKMIDDYQKLLMDELKYENRNSNDEERLGLGKGHE